MKMYITVGVSASGKSEWTKQQILKNPNSVEVNRDKIRFEEILPGGNWSNYQYTRTNESHVTKISRAKMLQAIAEEKDIIVSDTNLNSFFRDQLIEFATDNGYKVEIVKFDTTLKDAITRDNAGDNPVGHTVILNQWEKWEKFVEMEGAA